LSKKRNKGFIKIIMVSNAKISKWSFEIINSSIHFTAFEMIFIMEEMAAASRRHSPF